MSVKQCTARVQSIKFMLRQPCEKPVQLTVSELLSLRFKMACPDRHQSFLIRNKISIHQELLGDMFASISGLESSWVVFMKHFITFLYASPFNSSLFRFRYCCTSLLHFLLSSYSTPLLGLPACFQDRNAHLDWVRARASGITCAIYTAIHLVT